MQSIARMKKERELNRKYGKDWKDWFANGIEEIPDLNFVEINGIDYEVKKFGLDPTDFDHSSEKDVLFCIFHIAKKLLQEKESTIV